MWSRRTGEVIPDLKRKLPGRGLWVSASRQAVAEAVRRHQFSKGFKRDVRVAPALAADTENLLIRSVIDALAMAAKAGQVVAGFGKVEDALAQGQAQALIHASDGAADGIRKLDAIARQNAGINDESNQIPVVTALTSEQLDLALGRSNVVHAALLAGPASKTFLSRSQTLVRYRTADDDRDCRQSGREFADLDCAQDLKICAQDLNKIRTAEWSIKTPGEKKLSVPAKTLTLKPRVETGTVKQSFSHGRTKQVVVEKRGKRRVGGDAPASETPCARAGRRQVGAAPRRRWPVPPRRHLRRATIRAWCCAR